MLARVKPVSKTAAAATQIANKFPLKLASRTCCKRTWSQLMRSRAVILSLKHVRGLIQQEPFSIIPSTPNRDRTLRKSYSPQRLQGKSDAWSLRCLHSRGCGCTTAWLDAWLDGWTVGWMHGCVCDCLGVFQGSQARGADYPSAASQSLCCWRQPNPRKPCDLQLCMLFLDVRGISKPKT